MRLQKHGKDTLSKVEITGITRFGIWILLNKNEYFLDYKEFPWFKKAKVEDIFNLKYKANSSIRWPSLDVDLEIASITNLDKYPLIYIK